jgi:hypothetical protein
MFKPNNQNFGDFEFYKNLDTSNKQIFKNLAKRKII